MFKNKEVVFDTPVTLSGAITAPSLVTLTGSQTLSNKTLTSPIISDLNISNSPPFESFNISLLARKVDGSVVSHATDPLPVTSLSIGNEPFTDDTQTQILCRESTLGGLRLRSNMVDTTTAQTLTNKTLTSPIINIGITLPNPTGGTVTPLVHNSFSGVVYAFKGPYAAGVNSTVFMARTGRSVVIGIQGFSAAVTGFPNHIFTDVALPQNFRPAIDNNFAVFGSDNGVNLDTPCQLKITSGGMIEIRKSHTTATFTAPGTAGIITTAVSFTSAN